MKRLALLLVLLVLATALPVTVHSQLSQTTSVVNLTWTDPAGCAACTYIVSRAASGSTTWTQIGTTAAQATTFQDTAVAPGSWDYAVQTQQGTAVSIPALSPPIVVPAAPAAPISVTVTWAASSTTVTLTAH